MVTPRSTPSPRISELPSSTRTVILIIAFSWGHVNPIGPRACYDEGKRVAETLTYGFHRQDGVDVRVARIFNTYGPCSHLARVTQSLSKHVLQVHA